MPRCVATRSRVNTQHVSDPNQGIASAQYISDHNLATKVGIIYDSSDVYSSGIYQKFVEESEGKNFEVVSAEAFTQDNNTDFSVQLQKAKDAGADLAVAAVLSGIDHADLFVRAVAEHIELMS